LFWVFLPFFEKRTPPLEPPDYPHHLRLTITQTPHFRVFSFPSTSISLPAPLFFPPHPSPLASSVFLIAYHSIILLFPTSPTPSPPHLPFFPTPPSLHPPYLSFPFRHITFHFLVPSTPRIPPLFPFSILLQTTSP